MTCYAIRLLLSVLKCHRQTPGQLQFPPFSCDYCSTRGWTGYHQPGQSSSAIHSPRSVRRHTQDVQSSHELILFYVYSREQNKVNAPHRNSALANRMRTALAPNEDCTHLSKLFICVQTYKVPLKVISPNFDSTSTER